MMAGLLDMYFPAEDPMAPAALVPAGLLNGDGSRALNKARGLLAEQPGYAYGSILPFKRDTATDDLSFAIPGFARDSATGILDMLEGKMTPEASMALLDIPIGGLLHAGVTGARQTPETLAAIRAYHGSPHRFDRFDMGKIGTGEGAQAYGHGLYFAEAEDTARTYQKALANIAHPDRGPEWVAKQWLSENGGDVATAEAALRESITSWKSNPIANNDPQLREMIANMESAIPLLGRVTPEPGALYTTRLNVEPDDLLDWDKPLSEQSAKVRAALESALPTPRAEVTVKGNVIYENGLEIGSIREYRRSGFDPPRYSISAGARTPDREFLSKDDAIAFLKEWGNAQTGEDIYRLLNTQFGFDPAKASAALREAGIPGIKYLDQGSRAFKARTTYKGKPYSDDVAFATREQAERWAEQKRAEGFGAEVFQDGTRNFIIFDDSLISIESIE